MQPLYTRVEMALRSPREGSNRCPTLGSRGGEEEGSISSSQFCPELFPKSLLKRAILGEPVSTKTPIPFPRGNAGHTVSQEDADHLHSLLYSPYHRPDLHHIYPRVSVTLKQPLWQAWLGDMHTGRFLTPLWQAYVLGLKCCVLHCFWNFLNGL